MCRRCGAASSKLEAPAWRQSTTMTTTTTTMAVAGAVLSWLWRRLADESRWARGGDDARLLRRLARPLDRRRRPHERSPVAATATLPLLLPPFLDSPSRPSLVTIARCSKLPTTRRSSKRQSNRDSSPTGFTISASNLILLLLRTAGGGNRNNSDAYGETKVVVVVDVAPPALGC